jgi:AcrR family transcriptional regulator
MATSPSEVRSSGVSGEGGEAALHLARVAARLFAERGYDATSVREIVEAAGVTKPTLYYHFGSKEGLAQALLTRPVAALIDALGREAQRPDPVEALAGMLEANFAFCRDDPARSKFLYALFFGPLASGLAAEVAGFGEAMDRLWNAAAARLAGAGLIVPGRKDRCAASLRGLVVVYTVEFLYHGRALEPGLGRLLVADLLSGMGRSEGDRSDS